MEMMRLNADLSPLVQDAGTYRRESGHYVVMTVGTGLWEAGVPIDSALMTSEAAAAT